ncbi:MAG: glycosyltransferase family 4 protein [Gammaproteobacteria bacterium]
MIRIAYLVNDIAYGGAAKSLYYLLRKFDPDKYQIVLYTTRISSHPFAEEFAKVVSQINVVSLPQLYSFGRDGRNTSSFRARSLISKSVGKIDDFIEELARERIDLLHINTTVFAYLPPYIKTRLAIPIVIHVRELLQRSVDYTFKLMVKGINEADRIICITDNELIASINIEKSIVLPNPLDETNKISLSDGSSIGMLGTFSKTKGIDVFLKTVYEVHKADPTFPYNFILVTSYAKRSYFKLIIKSILRGNYYQLYIKYLIDIYRLNGKVIIIPNMREIDMFYDKLAIYLRVKNPWGRDIIETMNRGIPIVAGGNSDYFVKNNETGYLVRDSDPKIIAQKIISLAYDSERRRLFSENSHRLITHMCDPNAYAAKIEAIYNELYRQ